MIDDGKSDLITECLYEARYIEAHLILAWMGPEEEREKNIGEAILFVSSVADTLGMTCFKREDWGEVAQRKFGDGVPPRGPFGGPVPKLPPSFPVLSGGAAEPVPTSHDY